MEKTFKIEIKVNKCNEIFKKDMNKGVLGYLELTYNLSEKDYENPRFKLSLIKEGKTFLNKLVNIKIKEVLNNENK